MPPTLRANRPATAARRRFTAWDALVALALGLGLAAAGWADLRAYQSSHAHTIASLGLIDQQGDTRIGGDEFFQHGAIIVHLHNVGATERDGETPFRHAIGPTVTIETWSTLALEQVDFTLVNSFPDQEITVAHNGQVLEQFHFGPGVVSRSYHVSLQAGSNQFTITFAVYNHHGIEFGKGEERLLAGTFRVLNVHF